MEDKILQSAIQRAVQVVTVYAKGKIESVEYNNDILIQDQKGIVYITIKVDKNGYFTYDINDPFIDSFLRLNNIVINDENNCIVFKKFNREFNYAVSRSFDSKDIIEPINVQNLNNTIGIIIDTFSISSIYIDDVKLPVILPKSKENKNQEDIKTFTVFVLETLSGIKAINIKPIIDKNIRTALIQKIFERVKPKSENIDKITEMMSGLNFEQVLNGIGEFE